MRRSGGSNLLSTAPFFHRIMTFEPAPVTGGVCVGMTATRRQGGEEPPGPVRTAPAERRATPDSVSANSNPAQIQNLAQTPNPQTQTRKPKPTKPNPPPPERGDDQPRPASSNACCHTAASSVTGSCPCLPRPGIRAPSSCATPASHSGASRSKKTPPT